MSRWNVKRNPMATPGWVARKNGCSGRWPVCPCRTFYSWREAFDYAHLRAVIE